MNGRNSIKNRLVIIEYLECFAVVNCQMMMFDCLVTNELNISSYATVLVNCIGHILQAVLNPLVGALADSLTGNLFWIVVGISLSISSNIFGILINFKAIPIYNRQILFYLALFLLISAKMTVGTRNALLFNYIITDTRSNIDQFIFMITMARNVTKAVASIIYCVNFYYRSGPVIFCCLGLLASVIGLIILLYSRNKIHIEPVEKGIFLKCIKWVFQRKKINDADQIFIIASKGKLVMNILLSSIGFYTSYHFLFQVLTHEFSLLTTNSQLTKRVLVFVFYTSNTILLIFVNHFFLNVYRKWKVDDVDLRLQGIAYNFMCIAMILLYLTLYRLRYASTAMIGEAQIRLYNGANETIRIKSSVSDIQINPGKLREIMHLPCTRECNVPIQIEFLHTKRIMDTEIKGEEVRSYTYIIKDNTMVKIERSDPVESPKGTSTFFVFANVDILQGLLIFDDEYPVSLVKNLTDYVTITIPSNLTFNGFKYKWQDEIYNHSTFTLTSGTVYSIFIHVVGSVTTYETNIIKLNLTRRINLFLLIFPICFGVFAFNVGQLSLIRFVILEAPQQISSFISSILAFSMGVGIMTWGLAYSLYPISETSMAAFAFSHIAFQFWYSKVHSSYVLFVRKQNKKRST